MSLKSVKKKEKKVSLNLKVPEGLDERLKTARAELRARGYMFNTSEMVTSFLEREVKKVEKEFGFGVEGNKENKVKEEKKEESSKPEKVEKNEEFDFPVGDQK